MIPRHYEHTSKKQSNFLRPMLYALVFMVILFVFFLYSKEILSFMKGNPARNIEDSNTEMLKLLNKGELNKKKLTEFKRVTFSYIRDRRMDANGYHFLARAYYYQLLLNGFSLDAHSIVELSFKRNFFNRVENAKLSKSFKRMYKNSLRAGSLNKLKHKDTNDLFICFFETLDGRKKKHLLKMDIDSIQEKSLPEEFKKLYHWLGIVIYSINGDVDKVVPKLKPPLSSYIPDIKERHRHFLLGKAYFFKKDYMQSLEYLRRVRTEQDYLTYQSYKLESEIFLKQNLPAKSIEILENLNNISKGEDPEIPMMLRKIIDKNPKLKTKVDVQL